MLNGKTAYAKKTNLYLYTSEGQVRLNHMKLPFLWVHELTDSSFTWHSVNGAKLP